MKQSLFLTALAAVLILAGCEQATTTKTVAPPSNLSAASADVRTKSATALQTFSTALNAIPAPQPGTTGVTISADGKTMTLDITSGAYRVVGTMVSDSTAGTSNMDLSLTLTNATDGAGGTVSGTMHETASINTTNSTGTIKASGVFDVTPAGGVKSTVGFNFAMTMAGGSSQPTVTGTVSVDGITYDITK